LSEEPKRRVPPDLQENPHTTVIPSEIPIATRVPVDRPPGWADPPVFIRPAMPFRKGIPDMKPRPRNGNVAIAAALAVFWLAALRAPGCAGEAAPAPSKSEERIPFCLSLTPVPGAAFSWRARMASPPVPGIAGADCSFDLRAAAVRPKKHIGRAWLELGLFMSVSGGRYLYRYTQGGDIEDWDFQITWHDQLRRFFTLAAWRFDSNGWRDNWTHSLAGGIYYQFSRTNNLSWVQSWLMSVAGSSFWEYCVELHEVVSINDQIMTGLGGYPLGESLYQLTRYLANQPNLILRAMGFLNPANEFNQWLDRKDAASMAYAQPRWHDFSLSSGVRTLSSAGQATQTGAYFALDTPIMELPEYGAAGETSETVKDTYFSRISVDYTRRGGQADEVNITADARSWAYVRQDIDAGLEGYCLSIGFGSGFQYFKKRPLDHYDIYQISVDQSVEALDLVRPRGFTDKLALIHLAGPVLDWTLFRRGWKFRSVTSATFDFGMINAFALNEYSTLHDIAGMKTTVVYYGYYYGFGGTFTESADLEWGSFRARGLVSFAAWGSADFLDRWQDRVTNNAHLDDHRTRWLLGAGWKVPAAPLELFLNVEDIYRGGKIQEVVVNGLEKRLFAGLSFHF
jgi:hypothetical protein